MFYTGKGDDGTTKDFRSGPGERKSKSSCQTEALGALDELNSFLGLAKLKMAGLKWELGGRKPAAILEWCQNCLFSVQAEAAGADKRVGSDKTALMERWIGEAEKAMPPVKSFFIPGGSEESALLDVVRTLSRKAERRAIAGNLSGEFRLEPATEAFLNRLSSLFYAMARMANHKAGAEEKPPWYT